MGQGNYSECVRVDVNGIDKYFGFGGGVLNENSILYHKKFHLLLIPDQKYFAILLYKFKDIRPSDFIIVYTDVVMTRDKIWFNLALDLQIQEIDDIYHVDEFNNFNISPHFWIFKDNKLKGGMIDDVTKEIYTELDKRNIKILREL
jgi:hypothetical protein